MFQSGSSYNPLGVPIRSCSSPFEIFRVEIFDEALGPVPRGSTSASDSSLDTFVEVVWLFVEL